MQRNDLKNIIHQRLIFAGDNGYSVAGIQAVLKPNFSPTYDEVLSVMDELIDEGIAGVKRGDVHTHNVYKLKSYITGENT